MRTSKGLQSVYVLQQLSRNKRNILLSSPTTGCTRTLPCGGKKRQQSRWIMCTSDSQKESTQTIMFFKELASLQSHGVPIISRTKKLPHPNLRKSLILPIDPVHPQQIVDNFSRNSQK
ncbi:MAG: hypothetical protein WCS07_04520, partial [Sphaerochaeta sp.]